MAREREAPTTRRMVQSRHHCHRYRSYSAPAHGHRLHVQLRSRRLPIDALGGVDGMEEAAGATKQALHTAEEEETTRNERVVEGDEKALLRRTVEVNQHIPTDDEVLVPRHRV